MKTTTKINYSIPFCTVIEADCLSRLCTGSDGCTIKDLVVDTEILGGLFD